jgi:hypothetical protein
MCVLTIKWKKLDDTGYFGVGKPLCDFTTDDDFIDWVVERKNTQDVFAWNIYFYWKQTKLWIEICLQFSFEIHNVVIRKIQIIIIQKWISMMCQ